jgi:hypothetical protein
MAGLSRFNKPSPSKAPNTKGSWGGEGGFDYSVAPHVRGKPAVGADGQPKSALDQLFQVAFAQESSIHDQRVLAINPDGERVGTAARTGSKQNPGGPKMNERAYGILGTIFHEDPQVRLATIQKYRSLSPAQKEVIARAINEAFPNARTFVEGSNTKFGYSPLADEIMQSLNGKPPSQERLAAVRAAAEADGFGQQRQARVNADNNDRSNAEIPRDMVHETVKDSLGKALPYEHAILEDWDAVDDSIDGMSMVSESNLDDLPQGVDLSEVAAPGDILPERGMPGVKRPAGVDVGETGVRDSMERSASHEQLRPRTDGTTNFHVVPGQEPDAQSVAAYERRWLEESVKKAAGGEDVDLSGVDPQFLKSWLRQQGLPDTPPAGYAEDAARIQDGVPKQRRVPMTTFPDLTPAEQASSMSSIDLGPFRGATEGETPTFPGTGVLSQGQGRRWPIDRTKSDGYHPGIDNTNITEGEAWDRNFHAAMHGNVSAMDRMWEMARKKKNKTLDPTDYGSGIPAQNPEAFVDYLWSVTDPRMLPPPGPARDAFRQSMIEMAQKRFYDGSGNYKVGPKVAKTAPVKEADKVYPTSDYGNKGDELPEEAGVESDDMPEGPQVSEDPRLLAQDEKSRKARAKARTKKGIPEPQPDSVDGNEAVLQQPYTDFAANDADLESGTTTSYDQEQRAMAAESDARLQSGSDPNAPWPVKPTGYVRRPDGKVVQSRYQYKGDGTDDTPSMMDDSRRRQVVQIINDPESSELELDAARAAVREALDEHKALVASGDTEAANEWLGRVVRPLREAMDRSPHRKGGTPKQPVADNVNDDLDAAGDTEVSEGPVPGPTGAAPAATPAPAPKPAAKPKPAPKPTPAQVAAVSPSPGAAAATPAATPATPAAAATPATPAAAATPVVTPGAGAATPATPPPGVVTPGPQTNPPAPPKSRINSTYDSVMAHIGRNRGRYGAGATAVGLGWLLGNSLDYEQYPVEGSEGDPFAPVPQPSSDIEGEGMSGGGGMGSPAGKSFSEMTPVERIRHMREMELRNRDLTPMTMRRLY